MEGHGELLKAHKQAIQTLLNLPRPAQSAAQRRKQNILQKLRNKRIALVAKLQEQKLQNTATLFQQLCEEQSDNSSSNRDAAPTDSANLSVCLRNLRTKKSLLTCYKLAGVSLERPDKETLTVRLDICGSVYHCFIGIVLDSSKRLHLHLSQHTLPRAIQVDELVKEHLDGTLGKLKLQDAWSTDTLMKVLRGFVQQTYHCCHSLNIRKETFRYLSTLSSDNVKEDYSVQKLETTTETYRKIHFHILHRRSGMEKAAVSLLYPSDLSRPKSHRPSTVKIRVNSLNNRRQPTAGMVSDIEDDYEEFTETAVHAFRKLPIEKAIQVVADAMAEW